MTVELSIAIGVILGLFVGLVIGRFEIRKRDERIAELEEELKVSRNVIKSLNGDNVKLRKKLGSGRKVKRGCPSGNPEGEDT